jgi:hypothetical protein
MRVRPTRYTFQSETLISWVLEGLTESQHWVVLDERENAKRGEVWDIAREVECKSIRLTQTGMNREGSEFLELSQFDVFGTLIEPST